MRGCMGLLLGLMPALRACLVIGLCRAALGGGCLLHFHVINLEAVSRPDRVARLGGFREPGI